MEENEVDENIKETLEKIKELEITANSIAENHFLGLINIVEQLSYIIKSEAEKIMEISD